MSVFEHPGPAKDVLGGIPLYDVLGRMPGTRELLAEVEAERDAARAALARVRAVADGLVPTMGKALQGDWEYASGIASAKILAALEPTDQPKGTK